MDICKTAGQYRADPLMKYSVYCRDCRKKIIVKSYFIRFLKADYHLCTTCYGFGTSPEPFISFILKK